MADDDRQVIRALDFLPSATDLKPEWSKSPPTRPTTSGSPKTPYRPKDQISRQVLLAMKHLIDIARQTPLTQVGGSTAITRLGFNPEHRMVLVEFTSSPTVYGYPHLSDDEVAGLLAVLQDGESLGHYVSTVIKPNHDHERVQF